jgi:hypothetical protein
MSARKTTQTVVPSFGAVDMSCHLLSLIFSLSSHTMAARLSFDSPSRRAVNRALIAQFSGGVGLTDNDASASPHGGRGSVMPPDPELDLVALPSLNDPEIHRVDQAAIAAGHLVALANWLDPFAGLWLLILHFKSSLCHDCANDWSDAIDIGISSRTDIG